MRLFFFLISLIFYFYHESLNANQPYDNDLNDKKLICYNKSQSIDDWGIKFLSNKKVILYSLDKFIYELTILKIRVVNKKKNNKYSYFSKQCYYLHLFVVQFSPT